jgi:hypothetical protein
VDPLSLFCAFRRESTFAAAWRRCT